jgi:hypothetical protein
MDATVPERLFNITLQRALRLLCTGTLVGLTLATAAHAAEPAQMLPSQQTGVPLMARQSQAASGAPEANRADERTAGRSRKIDHAVTPAGGAAGGQARCSHCQRAACPHCRLAAGNDHGHRQCQHGLCPAHCPVRPDVFGFYGTHWRRWPGSGVVQVANNEAATPARPPKSEVPGPKEESLEADTSDKNPSGPTAPERPAEPQQIPGLEAEQPSQPAAIDAGPALQP